MTDRDDARVAKALQGVDFPADRAGLLSYAGTRGAEEKTLQALRSLPDGQYGSVQEVVDAVLQEPEGSRHPGGTAR